jgi:outer membrane receptor protein involved in Fe transport
VSGVVNFILKKDFEGLEIDGALAEINEEGQANHRLSMLAGHNFLDDKMNVYLSAEWQDGDHIQDSDQDWRRDAWILLNNDTDPTATPADGQLDNILIRNARDAFFNPGGVVLLSRIPRPSPAADPDIPLATCAAPSAAAILFSANISGNAGCFNVGSELNSAYVFDSPGSFRGFNFGSFQDQNGASRRINIGGDGLNAGTEFGQFSRIPESDAQRYQIGFNYDVLNTVNLFGELKYVTETTYDIGQPTFFQGGIGAPVAGQSAAIFSTANFNVGTDNAYLPAGLRTLIQTNTRPSYDAAGNVLNAAVPDFRATFNMFGPMRDQLNVRDTTRFVLGARGDIDQLAFFNDINWEIGYTYGEANNKNREHALDVVRFAHSADAVPDTAGLLGPVGAPVCRVTLLNRQGIAVIDPLTGAPYSPTNPILTQCKPTNIFGPDLRDDSTELAGRAYWDAAIHVSHTNIQQDLLAFASASLWDLWGAGPIGVAAGVETRKEKTHGIGRNSETAGRLLFLNTGPDFATAGYTVDEYFGEVQLPLFSDSFLGKYAELSAAYRSSDYSTVGEQEVYNVTANYRPFDDLLLRFSYGTSIRVPNLTENFGPATQTFANGFVDPCDFLALSTFTAGNPVNGANRRTNCVALLGPSYNPDTTQLTYASGVPGVNSGNPFLEPEESRSYTGSIVYTPSFWPDATS